METEREYLDTKYFVRVLNDVAVTGGLDTPKEAFQAASHYSGDYNPRVIGVDYYSDGSFFERCL